jgi:hypothetical protein
MKVDMDVKDHLHSAFVLGKPDCELKMIPGDDGCQFIVTKGTKMYVNQYSTWLWGDWGTSSEDCSRPGFRGLLKDTDVASDTNKRRYIGPITLETHRICNGGT